MIIVTDTMILMVSQNNHRSWSLKFQTLTVRENRNKHICNLTAKIKDNVQHE